MQVVCRPVVEVLGGATRGEAGLGNRELQGVDVCRWTRREDEKGDGVRRLKRASQQQRGAEQYGAAELGGTGRVWMDGG